LITPDEIVPLLRELSLQCAHVCRDGLDDRVAQELENLSIVLADEAQKLQSLLLISRSGK
jgi:hypothetical protein